MARPQSSRSKQTILLSNAVPIRRSKTSWSTQPTRINHKWWSIKCWSLKKRQINGNAIRSAWNPTFRSYLGGYSIESIKGHKMRKLRRISRNFRRVKHIGLISRWILMIKRSKVSLSMKNCLRINRNLYRNCSSRILINLSSIKRIKSLSLRWAPVPENRRLRAQIWSLRWATRPISVRPRRTCSLANWKLVPTCFSSDNWKSRA